jgi:hypothetical protein
MVIETNVAGWTVTKILVDTGSSAVIFFASTFDSMKLDIKLLQPAGNPLFGFRGQQVRAIGKITLPVTFGDHQNCRTEHITFDVVHMYYSYNAIFGRGVTNSFSAAIHQGYLCMKLPAPKGIIAVYGDQDSARAAEGTATPGQRNIHNMSKEKDKENKEENEPPNEEPKEPSRAQPVEEIKKVQLFESNPNKQIIISALLDSETEAQPIKILRENSDIFAWSAEDLRGVDRSLIEHSLHVNNKYPSVKQKLRKMSEERKQAATVEVKHLLDAGVIRPVKYPPWLSNVVLVQKKNKKWRMCVDFTSLNKACPKDNFPLPRISTLVDAAAGCELLSLLDCFLGYHHIWMNEENEEKTSFITPFGTYCFHRMAEGLRNTGSTFACMTAEVFKDDKSVSTYVDDIVV